jgi:hypothetical protein
VQLGPIKPTLTAPGIKLLKLKYDEPLSNFAFKFNLRRYLLAVRTLFFNLVLGRGLHSSTFRLNVSTFCGISWAHDFTPVY